MNDITKLRFWCHKILPLVYDDSLSYYEVLTKVQKKINELVDSNNEIPEAITAEVTKQLSEGYSNNITEQVQNLIDAICKGIATDEGKATFTATPKKGGELIWLDGTLYKVTAVMDAGMNYIIGTNIEPLVIANEINKIKTEYLETENEHWNTRAERPHTALTYMYWKDNLYQVTKDIAVNDILYDSGDNQNLTSTYLGKEIYNHYIEMHESDNNLQTQIDGNDGDIEKLQTGLTNEVSRATIRENNIDGRISNIVAQSGTDNTEIVDGRKEADIFGGKIGSTIGDAIRAQTTLNAELDASDRPIKCLIPAGQTWGKIYARQGDTLIVIPSDSLQIPVSYLDPLPTDTANLYLTDKGGNNISYYKIFGNNYRTYFVDPQYFTIPEYYYAHLDSPVSFPISVLNLTRSIEAQGAGTDSFVRACYIQGKLRYSKSKQTITVTLPIVGYDEGKSDGQIGYYPISNVSTPYRSIRAIAGNNQPNIAINETHTQMTVTLNSGNYLVYHKKLYISEAVSESIPICGNIGGEFLNYTGNIPIDITPVIETTYYEENNKSLLTIQRFGEGYGQPESADSVIHALRAGFNGVRLNLQFTADNVPVCWHDPSANQFYHNVYDADGNLVPFTDESKLTITQSNIAELNQYRWGGTSYNLGIPRLSTSIRPFRPANKILVLEQKANWTAEQCNILANIIRQNGLGNKTYIAVSSSDQADLVHNAIPECYVGWAGVSIANNIEEYRNRAEQGYHLFWWAWDTTQVTTSQVATLSRLGIVFWAGDFSTQQSITAFMNTQCNRYCTGVETTIPLAGTAYFNTVIPKIIH